MSYRMLRSSSPLGHTWIPPLLQHTCQMCSWYVWCYPGWVPHPRGHCRPCYHEPGRPPYPPPSGKTPALSLSWSNWGQQYEGPQSRQGPGFQLLDSQLFCGLVKLPPPWASVSPKVLAESCSPSSLFQGLRMEIQTWYLLVEWSQGLWLGLCCFCLGGCAGRGGR